MFEDWIIESAQCMKCKQPMTVLVGMGAPGIFRLQDMYLQGTVGSIQGSYQCGLCGGYCCYDCSSYSTPCIQCKASHWNERQYVADPEIAGSWCRRLGKELLARKRNHLLRCMRMEVSGLQLRRRGCRRRYPWMS